MTTDPIENLRRNMSGWDDRGWLNDGTSILLRTGKIAAPGLALLFDQTRERLNLRWKHHLDPGPPGTPLPQAFTTTSEDDDGRTIRHYFPAVDVTNDGDGQYTITPRPPAYDTLPYTPWRAGHRIKCHIGDTQ